MEASKLSADVVRQERQLLHNILDLSEITVEEVMRPRGTYFSAKSPLTLSEFHGEVPPGDYVAIYAPESDEITAGVPLASFSHVPETQLDEAAEAVPYVPWCADLAYTLQVLREQFSGMGAVVNEYGETIGIVLAEDIIDTVLMAQPSRARRLLEREPVLEVSPGKYHVEGITTLRYLCKRLGIEYDSDEEDFVTVAGMMHEELEHLPAVGDACSWRGYQVQSHRSRRPGPGPRDGVEGESGIDEGRFSVRVIGSPERHLGFLRFFLRSRAHQTRLGSAARPLMASRRGRISRRSSSSKQPRTNGRQLFSGSGQGRWSIGSRSD